MSDHDPALVETVRRALSDPGSVTERGRVDGVYPRSVRGGRETLAEWQTRAVLDALDLPGRDRRVAAEALREAAAWMQDGVGETYDPSRTDYEQQRREAKARRAWLRARAAEIGARDE